MREVVLPCTLALAGCLGSRADVATKNPAASTRTEPAAVLAPAPEVKAGGTARLVVALIYDQLGSDTLLEHLPLLDPRGAIRHAIRDGAFFERSVYPYANTLTAPGHAAIHTGAAPSDSGVEGNSVWDADRQRAVAAIEDARYPVFGREKDGISAGPARLRAPTVAQSLVASTGGAARVVSLSLKDRSAILSVGAGAELVLWYDSTLGAFTSSSAWGPKLPDWVGRYQAEHPLRALLTPWVPLSPGEYAERLGPDDAPGEGDLLGFGTTFPHAWDGVDKPLSVLGCTPMLSDYLVGLARAAVEAHELGRDSVPDLLALSVSGTDGAGHVFGPDSWEYVDHLVRADRAAGAWLEELERSTPLAVVITSDHGVAPLPETRADGGRIFPEEIQRRVEAALVGSFGVGPWLAGILTPYVYLSSRAREHPEAARIALRAIGALRDESGLADAWAVAELLRSRDDPDPLRRALASSLAPDAGADIMFLARPHHTLDLREPLGKGTNHGTPYDYDTQVPVLAWGRGVPHLRQSEPVDQLRVAATLAHLLGVPAPALAKGDRLF